MWGLHERVWFSAGYLSSNCRLRLKACAWQHILKSTNLRKEDSFLIETSDDNVLSASDPESTLGERIHNARQEAGLTLNLAAHLAGVKPSTLRDWERDRSEPRVNKLVALAGIFGVSPTHLLAEEGNSVNPVAVTKGRNEKILAQLKSEMSEIEAQQKQLTKRLRVAATLLAKLK